MSAPKILFGIIVIIVGIYIGLNLSEPREIKFSEMKIGGEYTVSQLVVKNPLFGKTSAVADITVHEDMKNPLDVSAVFYDETGKRLGIARAEINDQLHRGETTTVNLKFDDSLDLKSVGNVRLEINPITPLETLERLVDKINKLPK